MRFEYGRQNFGLDLRHEDWQDFAADNCDLILCISSLHQQLKPKVYFRELANKARKSQAALFVSVPIFDHSKWEYLVEENAAKKGSPFFDNDIVKIHFSEKGLRTMAEKK